MSEDPLIVDEQQVAAANLILALDRLLDRESNPGVERIARAPTELELAMEIEMKEQEIEQEEPGIEL
ncbi:hypothetical protein [Blastococcus sp. SYSU DS0533]